MRQFIACLTLICAGLPGFAQDADAEKKFGSIGGKVINSVTGEPVRRATLSLMPMMSAGAGMGGPPAVVSATTDAEGKFLFEKLEPGRYNLSGEKAGFGRQQYGSSSGGLMSPGTQLTVAAGAKLTQLEFRMTPQAVITGKVVDEDGEPVTRAMVQALRQTSFSRSPMGMMGGPTNDIGEFRIANLAPGKYVLRADYRSMMPQVAGPQAKEGPRKDYVPTYYPGATDIANVAPIEVKAGQELTGLEIRLQKAQVYQVSGKVVGMPSSSRINVSMQPQRRPGSGSISMMSSGANLKPDGTFTVPSVQSGSYSLTAMSYDGGRPLTLGKTQVTVANGDVEGVVLQTGSPITVTGRLIRDGESQEGEKVNAQVLLQPFDGGGFIMPGRTDDKGEFRLEGVSREKLSVLVMGVPGDLYVASVRAGSVDVLANGLDLSNAETAPPLEIHLSPNGATVEGTVMNGDKPASGAMVALVPQPFRPEMPSLFQKTGATDQTGRFSIRGVAPGEYRAYAFAEYAPLQNMDAEELKAIEPGSVSVRPKEKAKEQIELKLIVPPAK